jgi:hypothetical protein
VSPAELLAALLELAAEVGLEVRRAPAAAGAGAELAPSSGVCRLRDRLWVVLSGADPCERQIEVLAGALRGHAGAWETRYLPPAVRERLEAPGGGAPRSG